MYLTEIIDEPAIRRIDISPLRRTFKPSLNKLIKIVETYGFTIRIVGGAVRDILLGKAPRDIDLLTDALPEQILFILSKNNIPNDTHGMEHGTVRIKFTTEEEYEITSLGYTVDDECQDTGTVIDDDEDCTTHHLTIHSGATWKEDAQRRDFSINSMSMSLDGHIYDYLNGYEDLRNQYIRFNRSPEEEISRDPVIIMRFFKLISMFDNPKFDKGIIPILKEKSKLVKKLKPKRLALEMSNITNAPNGTRVLKMMSNLGFGEFIKEL